MQEWNDAEECVPPPTYAHTPHTYPEALKYPTLLTQKIPGNTLSEGHYRLEVCQNVWDLVPRAQSVAESGCLLIPMWHTHTLTYIHTLHNTSTSSIAFSSISSIKSQGEKPGKGVFEKFSFFFKCSLCGTASSPVSPALLLSWIKVPAAIY